MRIKKFKNNEYILAEGVWVRNPSCEARALDINALCRGELDLFLANEEKNARIHHMQMEEMSGVAMENVVIASDGFEWQERQKVLARLPNSEVKVLGVNGSLARWSMVGEDAEFKRTMTFYVVNNPYCECVSFLPKRHRYYPNLVASTRTNPRFLEEYKGQPYLYRPTPDLDYSGLWDDGTTLDDYRNPVCAAISLAVRNGAKRVLLLCCDEAFKEDRPGATRMENGLFQYPQQIMCQKIIDRQLLWLGRMGVLAGDCSSGVKYENAEYIGIEDVEKFFKKEQDG
jgi:hypothetical protein